MTLPSANPPHPADLATVRGHPTIELYTGQDPVLVTVCCECGSLHSVLWFNRDRWYCRVCRSEGAAPPTLYPVS